MCASTYLTRSALLTRSTIIGLLRNHVHWEMNFLPGGRREHEATSPLGAPSLHASLQGAELRAGRIEVGQLLPQPRQQFSGGKIGFCHQPAFHHWPALRERIG